MKNRGNSQELAGASRPYRFFYWDFVCVMLVFAAVFGLTLGFEPVDLTATGPRPRHRR